MASQHHQTPLSSFPPPSLVSPPSSAFPEPFPEALHFAPIQWFCEGSTWAVGEFGLTTVGRPPIDVTVVVLDVEVDAWARHPTELEHASTSHRAVFDNSPAPLMPGLPRFDATFYGPPERDLGRGFTTQTGHDRPSTRPCTAAHVALSCMRWICNASLYSSPSDRFDGPRYDVCAYLTFCRRLISFCAAIRWVRAIIRVCFVW
ncbi:hypothetical protein B0H19DRAFT_1234293 [Mycena capillaripes]|nr:hypothetical protein B0H19DRAFT_1234293 [Mycena capillaripes]